MSESAARSSNPTSSKAIAVVGDQRLLPGRVPGPPWLGFSFVDTARRRCGQCVLQPFPELGERGERRRRRRGEGACFSAGLPPLQSLGTNLFP